MNHLLLTERQSVIVSMALCDYLLALVRDYRKLPVDHPQRLAIAVEVEQLAQVMEKLPAIRGDACKPT